VLVYAQIKKEGIKMVEEPTINQENVVITAINGEQERKKKLYRKEKLLEVSGFLSQLLGYTIISHAKEVIGEVVPKIKEALNLVGFENLTATQQEAEIIKIAGGVICVFGGNLLIKQSGKVKQEKREVKEHLKMLKKVKKEASKKVEK